MNTKTMRNASFAILGTYFLLCAGILGHYYYTEWKADRERAKLNILKEEFENDAELIAKYQRGDIIDVEAV